MRKEYGKSHMQRLLLPENFGHGSRAGERGMEFGGIASKECSKNAIFALRKRLV